jgi:hypothetical protein
MSYPVGTRVRLTDDAHIWEDWIIPTGTTGVVIAVEEVVRGLVRGQVRLDNHFFFMEEWQNVLYIWDADSSDINWGILEAVDA